MTHNFPTEVLDDRCAYVGTSGSGKSTTAKLGVEKLLKAKARVCVVDPLGVWWGLRSSADGKGAGFAITIFGGEHGDVPLNERAGKLLGETIAEGDFSCIVDLSTLKTMKARRQFMKDFAEALYDKNRNTLHLVLDEADLWAPQKPLEDIAALLGSRIDEIVRRGRVRGFVPWLLTQRPAVIHKDVLSQLDTLFAMKLTSSQDRKALDAWIEGQADSAERSRIYGALPGLSVGQGLIWAPGHKIILEERQFMMPITFDSMRTPKRGERIKAPKGRAEVDLDKLRTAMAEVEQEAASNDPRALKVQIAEGRNRIIYLEGELAKKVAPTGISQEEANKSMDAAHALGKLEGEAFMRTKAKLNFASLDQALREAVTNAMDGVFNKHLAALMSGEGKEANDMPGARAAFDRAKKKAMPEIVRTASGVELYPIEDAGFLSGRVKRPPNVAVAPRVVNGDGAKLAKAERAILTALAQYPEGRTKAQIAILCGYASNSGSFSNSLGSNRSAGRLEGENTTVMRITEQGLADLGSYDPLPHGRALLDHWLGQLGKAEAACLKALVEAYPERRAKDEVAAVTGYAADSGSFSNALGKLRTLELIDGSNASMRASDSLFG